jgi:hypothetical protein
VGVFRVISQGHVFRRRAEAGAGNGQALGELRLAGKLMGKTLVRGQLSRVGLGRARKLRIPIQLFQSGFLPDLVDQAKKLLLR